MKNVEKFKNILRVPKNDLPEGNYSAPPPDKSFLRLKKENFRTEIYGNTQTFAFKVPKNAVLGV